MGQKLAQAIGEIEIFKMFRRWKWILIFAGGVILAGTLAFVWLQSKKDFTLGIMLPKQIGFSFNDKENFEVSTRSLNKYDYEKVTLFLLNQDLFNRYLNELPKSHKIDPSKLYDLRTWLIPKYALDFSNAGVRNEALQYLLFKTDSRSGLSADVIGSYVLNIFKNYYLQIIFRDYFNSLQTKSVTYLDNQRIILDHIENVSLKLDRLREQRKKYPGNFSGRGNFMLQVSAENERYLDLEQQVAANDILLSDSKIALEQNQTRIARLQFMIRFVNELRQEYLEILYRDPQLAKNWLLKIQAGLADKELTQESQKLAALFEVIDGNFKVYHGDPRMFQDRFILLKALAIFIFAFGLLLLAVLVMEHRKKTSV